MKPPPHRPSAEKIQPPSSAPIRPRITLAMHPKPAPRVILPVSHPAIKPIRIQPIRECVIVDRVNVNGMISPAGLLAPMDKPGAEDRKVSHIPALSDSLRPPPNPHSACASPDFSRGVDWRDGRQVRSEEFR